MYIFCFYYLIENFCLHFRQTFEIQYFCIHSMLSIVHLSLNNGSLGELQKWGGGINPLEHSKSFLEYIFTDTEKS